MILTVATGCDNVAWGGIDVAVEAPGHAEAGPDGEGAEASEIEPPPTPVGPILLAGTRQGSSLTLAPVGMLVDDRLTPLPAASDSAAHRATVGRLRPGSEWVLFASGARVGTATARAVARDAELCEADVTLTATPELIPAAAATERFLALPAEDAEGWPSPQYVRLDHTYNQRVASLNLSAAAVPRVGAAWPSGGMLATRRDIQAFRPLGAEAPSIAASFVIADGLNTLAPANGAYALFLLFEERPAGFQETFLWYRPAAQGKAVPRLFQHLDWDGDGTDEVLLEVFGEGRRGWVGLERGADQAWTVAYRSPCAHTMGAEGG
ncbi:MAG TPA: hypothetical protein VMQ81_03055 [Acidimicrobiia bacterium]|nr:hypothetical protein [Acidimicrobiia bacterium]